ncbi:hypothetical protein [Orbus mooreae]
MMSNNSDNKDTLKDKIKHEEKQVIEELKEIKEDFKEAEKIFEEHPPSLQ